MENHFKNKTTKWPDLESFCILIVQQASESLTGQLNTWWRWHQCWRATGRYVWPRPFTISSNQAIWFLKRWGNEARSSLSYWWLCSFFSSAAGLYLCRIPRCTPKCSTSFQRYRMFLTSRWHSHAWYFICTQFRCWERLFSRASNFNLRRSIPMWLDSCSFSQDSCSCANFLGMIIRQIFCCTALFYTLWEISSSLHASFLCWRTLVQALYWFHIGSWMARFSTKATTRTTSTFSR